jgi:Domain of unknown function (DUF5050)
VKHTVPCTRVARSVSGSVGVPTSSSAQSTPSAQAPRWNRRQRELADHQVLDRTRLVEHDRAHRRHGRLAPALPTTSLSRGMREAYTARASRRRVRSLRQAHGEPAGASTDAGRDRDGEIDLAFAGAAAASGGAVMSVLIAGGGQQTLAASQGSPERVVVGGDVLYWTNSSAGTVQKLALAGGTPTPMATQQGVTGGLAVDANALYWSSIGQKAVRSLSLANGGAVSNLATNQSTVLSVQIRNGMLYWADDDAGAVFRVPVAGGTPTPLINGQSIHAIAVDDSHVYWSDDIGNKIVRMPVAGGATVVVASNQATPSEIAIDDKNIYWVNSTSNGAVLKLAK